MGDTADLKKRVKALLAEPDNLKCSECRSSKKKNKFFSLLKTPERGQLGVFCCKDCHLFHVALGEDYCTVKSLKNPEEWTESDVEILESSGNKAVNAIYESGLEGNHTDKHMGALASAAFVEMKYKQCVYFSEKALEEQLQLRAMIQFAKEGKPKEQAAPPSMEDKLKSAFRRQTMMPIKVRNLDNGGEEEELKLELPRGLSGGAGGATGGASDPIEEEDDIPASSTSSRRSSARGSNETNGDSEKRGSSSSGRKKVRKSKSFEAGDFDNIPSGSQRRGTKKPTDIPSGSHSRRERRGPPGGGLTRDNYEGRSFRRSTMMDPHGLSQGRRGQRVRRISTMDSPGHAAARGGGDGGGGGGDSHGRRSQRPRRSSTFDNEGGGGGNTSSARMRRSNTTTAAGTRSGSNGLRRSGTTASDGSRPKKPSSCSSSDRRQRGDQHLRGSGGERHHHGGHRKEKPSLSRGRSSGEKKLQQQQQRSSRASRVERSSRGERRSVSPSPRPGRARSPSRSLSPIRGIRSARKLRDGSPNNNDSFHSQSNNSVRSFGGSSHRGNNGSFDGESSANSNLLFDLDNSLLDDSKMSNGNDDKEQDPFENSWVGQIDGVTWSRSTAQNLIDETLNNDDNNNSKKKKSGGSSDNRRKKKGSSSSKKKPRDVVASQPEQGDGVTWSRSSIKEGRRGQQQQQQTRQERSAAPPRRESSSTAEMTNNEQDDSQNGGGGGGGGTDPFATDAFGKDAFGNSDGFGGGGDAFGNNGGDDSDPFAASFHDMGFPEFGGNDDEDDSCLLSKGIALSSQ